MIKKFYLKLLMSLLLVALAVPQAWADEITVANGTNSDSYVPLYGSYMDESGTYSQTVYSSTMLSALAGQKITQISYYPTAALPSSLAGDVVKISLKEVDQDGFTSKTPIADMTECGTCTIEGGESQLTFTLDNPFTYSGTKNLAIEVHMVSKGSGSGWASGIYWYYEITSGNVQTSLYHYSNTTGSNYFIPKTTFTYEAASTEPTIKVNPETVTIDTDPYTAGSATFTVTGTNLTNDINLSVSGSGFAVIPNTIAAANAANGVPVTVTYSAQGAGTFNGTVTLASEGAESKTVTVNANVIQPVISGTVTPTSLNFETYAGVSATGTITVENTGNKPFTPSFTIAAPFSIEAATEIAAGASKDFTVTYAPTAVGSNNGTLTVDINGTTTNVSLNGIANVAPKEVTVAEDGTPVSSSNMSPIPVEGSYFDTQGTYGQTIYKMSDLSLLAGKNITKIKYYSNTTFNASKIAGVVLEVYLMETENDGMPFDGLTFSGPAIGEYTIQGGENEVEFNLTEPFIYSGNKNLAVQVRVKTAKSWQNIAWIGKIVASEWISYYKYGSYSGRSNTLPKTTFSYEDGETPTITVNPVTVDAFSTEVGTPVTATVNVTGENLTDAITATVSGTNASYFTAVLENGVLTITYNPTEAGNHTATVTLSSTGAQDVTIALNGTATAPAQPYAVTVNPDNGYNFGNVIVNNTKVWTLTVTNNGTESVTPTLSGLEAPFSTNYTAEALAAGESVNIEITFAPTELIDYSNTITLSFPEANGAIADYTYELTGKGVDESYDPSSENEVVKLVTVDKRSSYEPNFVDPNPNHSQAEQQLNCYDMRFRMAQPDDPAKQIKAGDLRPGNNLYEFYAIDDFGTEFRFATINLYAEGNPSTSSTTALDAPIKVTPSIEYYTEEGMPVHPTYSHYTTLNYTEKIYNDVNELVDLEGVIDYVNDTWSANTATNSHPDHYKFQIRGVGQFGEMVTSLTAEYVESHMTGYGNSLVLPEGWDRGSWVGPNNETDNVHTYYYYDLYIKKSFFDERGITGPVTVVVNTTLSGSGFNADNYKAMSVNGVEQIIAKEEFKDYSWTVPLMDEIPENTVVEQVPMGVVIRLVSTGADFNRTTGIYIYGGGTGVSNVDTVNIYKSSMNVKAYTQKQVDEDTDRNLVAMKSGDTSTANADVNVLAYADPAVTSYTLYENSSASTTGMTQVATATHQSNGDYSVQSTSSAYIGTYEYERDESLGNIDGMWLPMFPADPQKYFLPVTTANGIGYDGVVLSEGNTYGSAMQQVEKNGSVDFDSSKCYKSTYTWVKDGVEYAIYNPEVDLTSEMPAQTGFELYDFRLWVDYEDDAPAWDFEVVDGKIHLTNKMDRPLYDGPNTHIGGQGAENRKDEWAFVAPSDLENVKLVARFYYKKTTGSKVRPTDRDRLYYVVEQQETIPMDQIITGIDNIANKNVANVKYYNVAGVESDVPFNGVNIVVTTYDDGSRTSHKIMK